MLICILLYCTCLTSALFNYITTIIANHHLSQWFPVQSPQTSVAILFCDITKSSENVIADIVHCFDHDLWSWKLLCTHKVCNLFFEVLWLGVLLNFTCLQVSYWNKNPAYFANIKAFSTCHCLIKVLQLSYSY